MPIICAVGLFCFDKFEETPSEKVVNMSKLTKPYFRYIKSIFVFYLKNRTKYLFIYSNGITLLDLVHDIFGLKALGIRNPQCRIH